MSIGVGIAISPSFEGSHIPGVSALFSYPKNSYNQGEADPTPTITGTPGGTFSGSTGIVFVDSGSNTGSSTGQIDLSASSILGHTITYTVSGISSNFELLITAVPYQSTSSFSFDGVNDYFQTGSITLGSVFTFSCWLNVNSFSLANQCFLSSPNYFQSGFDGNFVIRLNNNTTINFFSYDGTGSSESITCTVPTISTGSWHHFSLINNGTTAQYYWDGSPITTTGVNTKGLDNLINGLIIGDNITNNNNAFNGNIDEVSLWNTNLSSDAITEIAAGPNDLESLTNASSSNLVAWYKMGE